MIQPKSTYCKPIDYEPVDYEPLDYEPMDYEPLNYEPLEYEPLDCEPMDYDETVQAIDELINLYEELETEYVDDFDFLEE